MRVVLWIYLPSRSSLSSYTNTPDFCSTCEEAPATLVAAPRLPRNQTLKLLRQAPASCPLAAAVAQVQATSGNACHSSSRIDIGLARCAGDALSNGARAGFKLRVTQLRRRGGRSLALEIRSQVGRLGRSKPSEEPRGLLGLSVPAAWMGVADRNRRGRGGLCDRCAEGAAVRVGWQVRDERWPVRHRAILRTDLSSVLPLADRTASLIHKDDQLLCTLHTQQRRRIRRTLTAHRRSVPPRPDLR